MKMTMKQAARLMTTKGLKGIGTLLHSVIVLIVFWVAVDIVQRYVASGPQRPGLMATALGPVTPNPREYGYFAKEREKVLAKHETPKPVEFVQVPKSKPVVVAKAKVKVKPRPVIPHESVEMVVVAKAPKPASCKTANWAPWCQESKPL